ncbi:GOLPH3/VPS74 family protein [Rhodovarius lipocyclicus]|uniref:GOLPH3/VPS74 family protein n=1 Tax=Rhodovarius lipocyclicus TaxID=268410 RepID=UPI00135C0BF7|nr:GPP34 family phosphoprotein [Rhodovarius lipocyclicus]
MIGLKEEIVLLTLEDGSGEVLGRQGPAAALALAGAVLMELSLLGRVDTDRERLLLPSAAPTADAVLDEALRALSLDPPANTGFALAALARGDAERRAALLEKLVAEGLLWREKGGFLRLFSTRYPKAAGREEVAAVRERLRALVLGSEIPEPRDALLLGLARATGLLPLLFSAEELAASQGRLELLVQVEALNRSLAQAVADVLSGRLRAAGSA